MNALDRIAKTLEILFCLPNSVPFVAVFPSSLNDSRFSFQFFPFEYNFLECTLQIAHTYINRVSTKTARNDVSTMIQTFTEYFFTKNTHTVRWPSHFI